MQLQAQGPNSVDKTVSSVAPAIHGALFHCKCKSLLEATCLKIIEPPLSSRHLNLPGADFVLPVMSTRIMHCFQLFTEEESDQRRRM